MIRHFSSHAGGLARGAILAILALGLAGCGEEPTPPRLIGFSPAVLSVPANATLAVSVEYEENDFPLQDFRWTSEAGEIEGNGSPSITWHAPAEPGDYAIAVEVTYGEENTPLTLDSAIKVTAPIAAEIPADVAERVASADDAARSAATTDAPAENAAPPGQGAAESAPAQAQGAIEQAAPPAEGTAPPVEQAAEGGGPPAEGAVEQAAPPTERTAASTAEPVERAAAPTGDQAKPSAAPTEQAAGEAAAPAGEGAGLAGESVEQTARTTIAAIREEVAAAADTGHAVGPGAPGGAGVSGAPPAAAAPGAEPGPAVAALTQEAAEAPADGSRLDRILDRHRIIAIVQIDFEPFSFHGEDGPRTGFEIDLVREFARRWLDDPKAVTFLPVPTDARIPTLQKGRADLIAAALTRTPERARAVDFSLTYFKDGQRLLVREGSDIADVCDLRGRKVAAIDGSTSLDNVKAAAASCGFELGDGLVTFRRHDEAIEALLAGEVDAFTSDGVALANFAKGRPLEVVGNHFSEEPYSIGVPKGDARLLQLVNHTLKQMERDGTYAALYEKWFGDDIRPYPLGQPEPAAPEVAALAATTATAVIEPKAQPHEAVEEYVVQPGDTLSRIAGKVYGDVSPRSWRRIYEANREVIGDDPSRIQVGMTLTIPQ